MDADADHQPHPNPFLVALQRHARVPLSTAERIVEREHAEVTAERDAFIAFAERLRAIDSVATIATMSLSHGYAVSGPPADADVAPRRDS